MGSVDWWPLDWLLWILRNILETLKREKVQASFQISGLPTLSISANRNTTLLKAEFSWSIFHQGPSAVDLQWLNLYPVLLLNAIHVAVLEHPVALMYCPVAVWLLLRLLASRLDMLCFLVTCRRDLKKKRHCRFWVFIFLFTNRVFLVAFDL